MKDKVLMLLSYLDCVNRFSFNMTHYNSIDTILNQYCNKHLCNSCALCLEDLTCLSVYIRNKYNEWNSS